MVFSRSRETSARNSAQALSAGDSTLTGSTPGDSVFGDSSLVGESVYGTLFPQSQPTKPSVDEHPLPVVRLRGVELHAITEQQCVSHILDAITAGRGGSVVTPNLDIIRRCTKDLQFAALVSEADLVVPDGTPLIWASRVAGTPLPERVAGSDLIKSLTAAAARAGRSVFFLGGMPGAAEGAAAVLKQASPSLKIAGTLCPPVGFEDKPEEMDRIVRALTDTKPDIVWVALGSPKQENLINRLRDVLPGAWWLGVGISFSFLTGEVKRAPKILQKLGLEWAHRLTQEPKRLAKRYLVDGLPFCATLMAGAVMQRFTGVDYPMNGHRFRGRRPQPTASAKPAVVATADAFKVAPPTSAEPVKSFSVISRQGAGTARALSRLKAVILLGGKVRQTSLGTALERSVLDLPLEQDSSILDNWVRQCNGLANRAGLENLAVRVMVDQKAHEPTQYDHSLGGRVRVERDRSSFRGTGGLIADIAADYDDDDLILVANASQVLLDPLSAIAQALAHKTGDFTLISHNDGTASGIMLLSCKTVRGINPVGFIDLKEQALPSIAKGHDVRVVHCRQPIGLPLFSLNDYINALQQYHRRRASRRAQDEPARRRFRPAFRHQRSRLGNRRQRLPARRGRAQRCDRRTRGGRHSVAGVAGRRRPGRRRSQRPAGRRIKQARPNSLGL
ncbi:MAG: WecB/TagA/CpsF family glycosyltransferase [Tepidisphaeraceae bacterium]